MSRRHLRAASAVRRRRATQPVPGAARSARPRPQPHSALARGGLAELALAAAVMSWWSRWQPVTIHAALRTGADVADIAAATGLDPQRWSAAGGRGPMSRPAWSSADVRRGLERSGAPGAGAAGGGAVDLTRVARNVSTAAVATIAAWSSWSHMVHVALRFGERPEVAYVCRSPWTAC